MTLADQEFLESVLAGIEPLKEWRYAVSSAAGPDYLRGALRLSLGDDAAAEAHFSTGLAWAEQWGAEMTAARCRQGLAEVASLRGDAALAREHLDVGGAIFAKHGAKLYLDQVLAKKEFLKA